jgi:hypothetical protein
VTLDAHDLAWAERTGRGWHRPWPTFRALLVDGSFAGRTHTRHPLDQDQIDEFMAAFCEGYNQPEAVEQRAALEAKVNEKERLDQLAKQILNYLLSPDQRAEFTAYGYVTEMAPSGRAWRLYPRFNSAVLLVIPSNNLPPQHWSARVCLCVNMETFYRDWPEHSSGLYNISAMLAAIRAGDEGRLLTYAVVESGAFSADDLAVRRDAHDAMSGRPPAAIYPF